MVYFVCRSEYERPHGRRIVEYPNAVDLVDWFRKHWMTRDQLIAHEPRIAQAPGFDPWDCQDEIHALREEALGGGFYGLCELFTPMLDRAPPESLEDVADFVASFGGRYSEGRIEMIETSIQAHTNDDEIDVGWYLFDSDFSKRFPERTSFLLHKPFELPTEFDPSGWTPSVPTKLIGTETTTGVTYACLFSCEHGATITEIEGCYRIPTRLPNLGSWMAGQSIDAQLNKYGGVASDWPPDLILLRAFALLAKNHSFEEALGRFDALNQKLSGWLPRIFSDYPSETKDAWFETTEPVEILEEISRLQRATLASGEKATANYWVKSSGETRFQFSRHFCQAVFTEVLTAHNDSRVGKEFKSHWIFFDDLWASRNRPMAESILRYGRGENVLGA